MLNDIVVWLTVAAFGGAGLFNAIGTAATRGDFARWGFPGWWCRVTGGLEVAVADLVAFPATRGIGLALGAAVIAAALATVLRHQEFTHTAPIGLFAALLALAAATS